MATKKTAKAQAAKAKLAKAVKAAKSLKMLKAASISKAAAEAQQVKTHFHDIISGLRANADALQMRPEKMSEVTYALDELERIYKGK